MPRSLILCMFVLAMFAPLAWAEPEYWVVVGSFQSTETADRARREAEEQVSDSFSVFGAQTGRGYFYRVASGPYASRVLAQDRLGVLRSQGYSQAWVLAQDSTVLPQISGTSAGLTSDFTTDYTTSDLGLDLDLDSYTSELDLPLDYGASDTNDPEIRDNREPLPQIVEEAPAGYQLNRIRRDPS